MAGYQGGKNFGSKVVFFYGFPADCSEESFKGEILGPHPEVEVLKVDFFGKKLMAFVHCKTNDQAKALINTWNKKMMTGSEKPLQVRFKTADRGGRFGTNAGGFGGFGMQGGQGMMQKDKSEQIWASIALPGSPKPSGRPFNPKSVDDETHTKHGYAKEALRISGFDAELGQAEVMDVLSVFGPIHTFYEEAEGQFIVRYCYDLCTEFVHKHLVEEAESSGLVKNQRIPEGLTMERLDTMEEWV